MTFELQSSKYSLTLIASLLSVLPLSSGAEHRGNSLCGKFIGIISSITDAVTEYFDEENYSDNGAQAGLLELLTLYAKSENVYANPECVKFYIFPDPTNCSHYVELILNNRTSIENSGFDKSLRTIMLTHGFLGIPFWESAGMAIVNAYCDAGYIGVKANLIFIDWSCMSGPTANSYLALAPAYYFASENIYVAAEVTTNFILFLHNISGLVDLGEDTLDVHLIGHSLGAHVMGMTGKLVIEQTGKILRRITGADPAGPLVRWREENKRLNKNQAKFVDAIHSNPGFFGMRAPTAQADFYVNGRSKFQKACFDETTFFIWQWFRLPLERFVPCSHEMAPHFMALSIKNKYEATCRKCSVTPVVFGENCPSNANGIYSVEIEDPTLNALMV